MQGKTFCLNKYIPFIFSLGVVSLDQFTKSLVVTNIPLYREAFDLFGGLVDIVHHRNLGIAFGMGSSLQSNARFVVIILFPAAILFGLITLMLHTDLDAHFRWFIAGIVGGGMGNIYDRIFRPEGVVDFIKLNFLDSFGINYFPVINIADSFITICALLLTFFYFIEVKNKKSLEEE